MLSFCPHYVAPHPTPLHRRAVTSVVIDAVFALSLMPPPPAFVVAGVVIDAVFALTLMPPPFAWLQVSFSVADVDSNVVVGIVALVRLSDGTVVFPSFTGRARETNLAPTDISLTGSTVAENAPAMRQVGTLATTDPNGLDVFTYSLVMASGCLLACFVLLFVLLLHSFTLQRLYNKVHTYTHCCIAPSIVGVSITTCCVPADDRAWRAVWWYHSQVPRPAPFPASMFTLVGNVLYTNASLDFEASANQTIIVLSTDDSGASVQKSFVVSGCGERHWLVDCGVAA